MTQYIDKSALVAEIARQKAQWRICKSSEAKYRREMLDDISSFIDTLEEKEVQEEPVRIWHDASEKSNEPEEVDNPCKIRKNLQKDIVIVLNGQRHRQVLHKGCFSKKECKEKCSLYERCQRCCIDLCMIFFHDPHCHFEEESVSEDLEKEANKYSSCIYLEEVLSDDDKEVLKGRLINTFKAGANWQKENDAILPKVWNRKNLDDFSYQTAYDLSNDWAKETPTWDDVEKACKLGANWQKKQDQETIELAEDHAMFAGIIKGTEHTIGEVRSILNKVAYENNGLDVNGDYCEQPYVELDNEFNKLLNED